MDGFWALLILVLLAVPVMAVAAFFMVLAARRRIAALEQRVLYLETGVAPVPAATPAAQPSELPEVPASDVAAEVATPSEAPALPPPIPPELPVMEPVASAPAKAARPPQESLEQRLGARWAVWVGGLALALGAIFLVRYSIDAGLLGPEVRIAGAAIFSLALLAVGEWLRRADRTFAIPAVPSANIPSIITAAGTVGLFATAYGAYALYGLIGPTAAFALMALIGLGTMAAAALHGPWLSGLGLLGAYVAPLLVSTTDPNVPMLMLYLVFVTASAFGLARLRRWRWLAIAAGAGSVLWGLLLLTEPSSPLADGIYAFAILVLSAIFLVVDVQRGESDGRPDPLAIGILWALAALFVFGTLAHSHDPVSVAAALLGGAVMIAIAWRYDAVALAAPGAAGLAIAVLYLWPAAAQAAIEPRTFIVDAVSSYFPLPAAITNFASVAALAAAVLLGASAQRLQARQGTPFAAMVHAATAAAAPILILVVAYLRITGFVSNPSFAAIALALAALYAWLTARFLRADVSPAIGEIASGLFAATSIAGVALCLTMTLEGGVLTTAFALAGLGAAWVQLYRPLPVLRYAVSALALLVLARIAWDPYIFGVRSGAGIYLSILIGYGIPAAAFGLASVLLARARIDRAVYAAEALAVILTALLVVFEIRAFVFGGDLTRPETALSEQGLNTAAAFAFALGLSRLARLRGSPVFVVGAMIARVVGLATAVIGLGIAVNPIVTGIPVTGGAVFNEIFLAYAIPALLAALVALQPADPGRPFAVLLRRATGVVAFLLAFAAVSLEIRFLFAAIPDLSVAAIGPAESYTYSAAWLVFGLLLLLAGLIFDLKAARIASAALILLTVLKVFLLDMANLEGVWRALSFMGLGIVLIGIGLLYQRLLFGRRAADAGPAEPPDIPEPS